MESINSSSIITINVRTSAAVKLASVIGKLDSWEDVDITPFNGSAFDTVRLRDVFGRPAWGHDNSALEVFGAWTSFGSRLAIGESKSDGMMSVSASKATVISVINELFNAGHVDISDEIKSALDTFMES